jgi:PAS domain S-box-containing protein
MASFVLLILTIVLPIYFMVKTQVYTNQNRVSESSQRLAKQIPSMLESLDASDRAYVRTKDPAFLVTAKATSTSLVDTVTTLESQMPVGTLQAEEAAQLRAGITKRTHESRELANLGGSAPDPNQAIPESSDEMGEQVAAIAEAERKDSRARSGVGRQNSNAGSIIFLFGFPAALIMVWVFAYRLAKEAGELKNVQRELEASRRSLNEIVANTTSAITVNDMNGRYLLANDSSLRYMEKKREEVVGKTVTEVLSPSVAEGVIDMLERTKEAGKVIEAIIENAGADEKHAFSVVSIPMRDADGAVTAVAVVSTDVTPIRQAQLNAEAMRILADEASKQAERANRAKTDFLSRMSHELRTPMNAILGFAQLLQAGKLTETQHESVGHILRGGRHLLNLINDVLDISRIETRDFSLSLEPIEVRPAVVEVCEMVAPIAAKRGVRVIDETEPIGNAYVFADGQRLRQVLMNLVSNAIKYGPEEGEVRIRAEEEAGTLSISVLDSGNGIPVEKLDRLFTPFERFGAENTGVEGTGLGLALSRNLAEAMDGTLTYLPPEGERTSTFVVQLPLAINTELPESLEPHEGKTDGETTVLYIEDNLPNVKLIEMVFEQYPEVKLLVAMRGQMGLEMAREHRPDLILLDLHLPDMEGADILEEVKKDKRLASTPVIVVSADATEKQIKRVMGMGAHSYQTKPIQIDAFIVAVDAALAASKQNFLPRH